MQNLLLLACMALISMLPASPQGFHVGVKGGIPLTQYFETGAEGSLHGGATYSSATRRYTIGPSVEWRLTRSFGFEMDALYHRMGYAGLINSYDSSSGNFRNSAIHVKGGSWDVPALAKYRFGHVICPYVAAGGVVRYVGPVRARGEETDGSLVTQSSSTRPIDTDAPSELRKRWFPGIIAAVGLEVRVGRFRMLPEFRYTRWTANISAPGGLLRFASNQAEILAGILF